MKRILRMFIIALVWQGLLPAQSFTFDTPQLTIHKNPGQTIVFYNYLINNLTSPLNFRVIRMQNALPDTNWSSTICVGDSTTGLCYPPWVDTTLVHTIPASGTEPILLDVFTSPSTPGEAQITLRIENADDPSEFAEATFIASTVPTGIAEAPVAVTHSFRLMANYPNPFNPETVIPFEIGGIHAVGVRLSIYNILGQKVTTLVNKKLSPGVYQVVWNGRNSRGEQVASGVYFYELATDRHRLVRRMLFIR